MPKQRKRRQTRSYSYTKVFFIINIVLLCLIGFLFYKVYSNQSYNLSLWSAQSLLDENIPVPTGAQSQTPAS
jgi:hypothetical protein